MVGFSPSRRGSRVGKFFSPEFSGGNQLWGDKGGGVFYKTKNVKQKSLEVDVKVGSRWKTELDPKWSKYFLGNVHAETWGFMIRFDIPYFSDGLKSPAIGMVLDPAGRKNNSTRLVDEGFALLMVKLWRPGFGFCWFFLEISRVNESTNPEGWIHNGLLREMIQFDDHIFEMGWFNHQLGGFMRLYIHWNPQGVTTVSLCPRMASEWFQTLLP